MTPFRKSIELATRYPLTILLAVPGYILAMIFMLADFAGISSGLFKIIVLALFILVESFLFQPALSIHISNILGNEPDKPVFKGTFKTSRLRLLVLFLIIASAFIVMYIHYLLAIGIVAYFSSYSTLVRTLYILKYMVFPVPCLFIGAVYFSFLPQLSQPAMTFRQTLATSFKVVGRIWKRAIPALIIVFASIILAYWLGQIMYYFTNDISLLYLIDNPIPLNYAGILTIIACLPLYNWLICYFHCLQIKIN